ncbi:hypothetical protein B0H16DRAFT_696479 [Mycena metata]|uniref:Uncharacterized protein n=1 Tax=Mycena metata TaxID=1033252 RepID=A0AAD7J7P7_9AGAR|nr:hypothetical protein B0H16DRAFT_696479 [Mycena metata]
MNPPIAATPTLVPPTDPSQVQDSRAKRLVRQQARFRDRGGIFVPRAHNNLLDILLGRKKPSPLKRRSRSRSLSASPSKSAASRSKRGSSVGRKSGGTASKPPSSQKAKTLPSRPDDDEPEQPIAGPSRLPEAAKKPPSKVAASRKGKKTVTADEETLQESKPAPKRKGRPPKSTQPTEDELQEPKTKPTAKRKTKVVALDEKADDKPAPKKRATAPKSKASRKTTEVDAEPEDGGVPVKSGAKSKAKASKSGTDSKPKAKPKARATKASEDTEVDVDPPARPAFSSCQVPRDLR